MIAVKVLACIAVTWYCLGSPIAAILACFSEYFRGVAPNCIACDRPLEVMTVCDTFWRKKAVTGYRCIRCQLTFRWGGEHSFSPYRRRIFGVWRWHRGF